MCLACVKVGELVSEWVTRGSAGGGSEDQHAAPATTDPSACACLSRAASSAHPLHRQHPKEIAPRATGVDADENTSQPPHIPSAATAEKLSSVPCRTFRQAPKESTRLTQPRLLAVGRRTCTCLTPFVPRQYREAASPHPWTQSCDGFPSATVDT